MNEPFIQRTSDEPKVVEKHRYITKRSLQLQSYYYASLSPSISSVYAEPSRIGVRNVLSESKLIFYQAQGHLFRKWIMIPRLKSHQRTYRTLPHLQSGVVESEETPCGNRKRYSNIFQKIFNELNIVTTLVSKEMSLKDNLFMTIFDVHLSGYGSTTSCREYT